MGHFDVFAFSEQGHNHIKVGKKCQDASKAYVDESMSIIVVADGHGSDNYPRTDAGAAFAVEVTVQSIQDFVKTLNASHEAFDLNDDDDYQLRRLSMNILLNWHKLIDEDVANNPFTETELTMVSQKYKDKYLSGDTSLVAKAYGTTLIAVCATPEYWFGIHIGDGKCIAFDENLACFEPIPWDEACQANITTSLCDSDAIDEFRFFKSNNLPVAVFLGCDGIDDSYASDNELHNLYRSILHIFVEHGCERGKSEVQEFLPSLSKKGSGDDVSIAGLIKSDLSKETANLLKALIDYENATSSRVKLETECKIAEEKVGYVKDALMKTQKILADNNDKLQLAQSEYERKKSELLAAERICEETNSALEVARKAYIGICDPGEKESDECLDTNEVSNSCSNDCDVQITDEPLAVETPETAHSDEPLDTDEVANGSSDECAVPEINDEPLADETPENNLTDISDETPES